MTDLRESPLGHAATYGERYDAKLLFAVERAPLRAELGLGAPLPFRGADLWNGYELTWLDAGGKPQIAIATFVVPADSPAIVESKSVKLYLASFGQTRFVSAGEVSAALERDLSGASGATVDVALTLPAAFATLPRAELDGECLDLHALSIARYEPEPDALAAHGGSVAEKLFTRLFRAVCPVTGQPDYASVQIAYRGPAIDRVGLLRYLVSFRRHPGFHEHCVERIFVDVWQRCRPEMLSVYARFARRGGIDINPWRTSGSEPPPPNVRTTRQ